MIDAYELIDRINSKDYVFDEPNAMDDWLNYGFVKKDVFDGDVVNVTGIGTMTNSKVKMLCANGISINCDLKKDKDWFGLKNICSTNIEDIKTWISSEDGKQWFRDNPQSIMIQKDNHNVTGSLLNSHISIKSKEMFDQIKTKQTPNVYYAKVVDKNTGGFIVDIEGIKAFLPGGQAAANKIVDFNSFIGKVVPVMVEDFIREGSTFIVSNKKYLKEILPLKIQELDITREYVGTVTGNVAFGIFIEFDEIFTGLLHMSEMSMETIHKFKNKEYLPGTQIKFYIKEINDKNKIILTNFELSERKKEFTFEDFKNEYEQKFETGEIINIKENLGIFVKFSKENKQFIGLVYYKEIEDYNNYAIGENITVFISKVVPESKKIFLKLKTEE